MMFSKAALLSILSLAPLATMSQKIRGSSGKRRSLMTENDSYPQLVSLPVVTDDSAQSIQSLVEYMAEAGMDRNQTMGVLHSKGYTNDRLAQIFEGHEEENDQLNQLFGTVPVRASSIDGRHLAKQDVPMVINQQREPFAEGELEELLQKFHEQSEARFASGPHRSLQGACDSMVSTGAGIATAYDAFTKGVDMEKMADYFDRASSVDQKRMIAQGIKALPLSQVMLCVAEAVDSTITIEFSFDATVLFFNADFGLNLIFGEENQFALALTTGFGFDLGLLGVGTAVGVSVSNRATMGGFDTVASTWKDPDVCFSIGYTPYVVGGAVTFSITPSAAADNFENAVISKISKAIEGNDEFETGDMLDMLGGLFTPNVLGITSVGFEATIGIGVLDLIGAKLVLPDISIHACTEELLLCDGKGCDEKMMVETWNDGTLCGLGTTCEKYCKHKATYWYSKAFTACGSEPKWNDGSICALGTTCNACRNKATYWWSKAITACGNEPKWSDGKICAKGTTCNACKNKATYWWGKAFTACGSEPKWSDGTRCLTGTSCNACKNGYEWWDSKFGHHCGREPCWGRGTVCGAGTTCNNCCSGASCPWYQFGVCNCK